MPVTLRRAAGRRVRGDLARPSAAAPPPGHGRACTRHHPALRRGRAARGCRLRVFGELADLQAGGLLPTGVDPLQFAEELAARYESLWGELTRKQVLLRRSSSSTRSLSDCVGSTSPASTWTRWSWSVPATKANCGCGPRAELCRGPDGADRPVRERRDGLALPVSKAGCPAARSLIPWPISLGCDSFPVPTWREAPRSCPPCITLS